MSKYDDLLNEAKAKAEAFALTAREYIPKMYNALYEEDPNMSPDDARDRIQKDCAGIYGVDVQGRSPMVLWCNRYTQ